MLTTLFRARYAKSVSQKAHWTARAMLVAAAGSVAFPLAARAATRFYVGAGGNWNTTTSWSTTSGGAPGATVPVGGDTANLTSATSYLVPFDGDYPASTLTVLLLDGTGGATMTLSQTAHVMTAQNVTLGNTGSAAYLLSGGTQTVGSSLILGRNLGSSGSYTLSGTGALNVNGAERVGFSGTGSFNQTAGTHNVGTTLSPQLLYIGYNTGAGGAYSLSGTGVLSEFSAEVGHLGNGTFTHTAGTHNITGVLEVGYLGGSTGTYNLSGAGRLNVTQIAIVGDISTGVFNQTGGNHTITAGTLYLGFSNGATGNYSLSGTSSLSVDGSEIIGNTGAGVFNHSSGTNSVTGTLTLAANTNSHGTYNLSGAARLTVGGLETVGNSGVGLFNQTGGNHSTDALKISPTSSYFLSGGTLAVTNGIDLRGTMNCAGGTATLSAASGILDLGHGTFANTGQLTITGSANSLIIFPPAFNTAAQLAAYTNPGVTAFAGSPITIPAGTTILGTAALTDHVNVSGALTARGGSLALNAGVTVNAGGTAAITSLTVEDNSQITNSLLTVSQTEYVGFLGAGTFNQVGGTHTVGASLNIGVNTGASGAYTLSGGGKLTVSGDEFIGLLTAGSFNHTSGTHTVSGSLYLGYNEGSSATYTLAGSTSRFTVLGSMYVGASESAPGGPARVQVNGGSLSVLGTTTVAAGTLAWNAGSLSLTNLALTAAGKAVVAPSGIRTLRVNTLTMEPTATLDLNDNDLIVSSGAFTTIRSLVLSGFGNTTGITTSTSDGSAILALFDNAVAGASEWNGIPIAANAIVGKYTYFGDANFDGQVTGDDYTIIDSNLNTTAIPGMEWLSGDANLDGLVTGDDYTTIDSNLGLGTGNPLAASRISTATGSPLSPSPLSTPVPEPIMPLFLLGTGFLAARTPRRHLPRN